MILGMNVCSRMLVAVDGSLASEAALRLALKIARTPPQHRLRFVSGLEGEPAHGVLTRASAAAHDAGVAAETAFIDGDPIQDILKDADAWNATCIVIGAHKRTDLTRTLFGSCTQGILRASRLPVLVVAAAASSAGSVDSLLCAYDGSAAAQRAYTAAVTFAQECNATLHVVSVVGLNNQYAAGYEQDHFDPDGSVGAIYSAAYGILESLTSHAVRSGVKVETHVTGGVDVASLIACCAAQFSCALILMGTHGRGGVMRAILGSAAEGVITCSEVPVLAFHKQGRESGVLDPADVLVHTR